MTRKLAGADRRRSPRFHVEGNLEAECVPAAEAITVLDISQDGLAIRAERQLRERETFYLRLWSARCPPLIVHARVVRAMRVNDPESGAHCVAAAEFINQQAFADQDAIYNLIHSVELDPDNARASVYASDRARGGCLSISARLVGPW